MTNARALWLCSTPVALAIIYRSTLNLRLQTAQKRKAAGWASVTSASWGGDRVTYIPQHEARYTLVSMLFPPLALLSVHKELWWGLLSVPKALVDDAASLQ